MERTLDRSKPFVEVFGEDPEHPYRYRQFGMKFDEQGELVGEELPVPPDEETEAEMRTRIEKEIRAKLETEYREKLAESAKTGGGAADKADAGQSGNRGAPRRGAADKADADDLPGNLGKSDSKK